MTTEIYFFLIMSLLGSANFTSITFTLDYGSGAFLLYLSTLPLIQDSKCAHKAGTSSSIGRLGRFET